jgi:AcrR family transcriptional regulator
MPTERFLNLNPSKKNRIEAALIKEMMKHSYEHINLSNVIREANISRGSFYQYFINKHDFYFYILYELGQIKSSYMNIDLLQDASISFVQKLKHILEASITFSKTHSKYVDVGLQLYSSTHKEMKMYIAQAKNEMYVLLKSWINQDITYQNMQRMDDVIHYIADTMMYLTQYTLKFNDLDQLENHLSIFIKLLEGGLKHV